MANSYHATASPFTCFIKALNLKLRKTQLDNLILVGSAFLRERSLPIRRLARAVSGPSAKQHRYVDRRMRRFLENTRVDLTSVLGSFLRFLLPRLGPVPYVPVVLDWTFVEGRHAILWAQIPYRGRSFPLYCVVHPYEGEDAARTQAELDLLAVLRRAWPPDAPRPVLLADRGFPKSVLVRALHEAGMGFLIRARENLVLRDPDGRRLWDPLDLRGGKRFRTNVRWADCLEVPVHLVIAVSADGRSVWRLLTNLPEENLKWATSLYRHRMQPEETHRDYKKGHFVAGFALSHLGRLKPERLQRLICYVGLAYAFTVLIAETQREEREWLKKRHWGLSLATYGLDLIRELGPKLREATRQALGYGLLQPLWPQSGES